MPEYGNRNTSITNKFAYCVVRLARLVVGFT